MDTLQIIPFSSTYRDDFKRLNIEWLEKYFVVEGFDEEVLSNPEAIIAKGGQIFFAIFDEKIVGTCALMNDGNNFWELTKMAVTEEYQGLKIGRKLAEKTIEAFKEKSEGVLFLETNSSLKPAIALYESLGFERQKNVKLASHYERADVYMIYKTKA